MRARMLRFLPLLLLGAFQNSYASECYGVVAAYFTDTGSASGKVWVVMPNGLQWYVLQSDPDSHNIVAAITTSIVANVPIGVRFSADGVACDSSSGVRTDVIGMWLLRP